MISQRKGGARRAPIHCEDFTRLTIWMDWDIKTMTYDLSSLQLPKLNGTSLSLFAAALDSPLLRGLLLPSLIKNGGVDSIRAIRLDEEPTLFPFGPAGALAERPLTPAEVEASLPGSSARTPFATILDYANAYRSGSVTPLEVAERVLAALEKSEAAQPPLRAFIANNPEDLRGQARASAARHKAGNPISQLDGVPVAIKDEINQAPYPTFGGTSFLGAGPEKDCTAVARLRAAGALLIGKANMNELGVDPCGFNAHFGTARNPYNPAHDTGGSSSGPAAAVAAGFCPVALGCDGGGSIRIPAALCGLVGLKPTFGRVSESGAVSIAPSVDAIGPLGATAADVALAYGIIAGPDRSDPRSLFQPALALEGWANADLRGLTFGIYQPWFQHAAPAVVKACEAMLAGLEKAGARMVPIEIPGLDAMRVAHVVTIITEMVAHMQDKREHFSDLSAPTRLTYALARGLSSVDYVQAQRLRTRAIATFEDVLGKVDAILTPASAITAPLIPNAGLKVGWSDLSSTTEKMRYVFPSNLTGHPAISFPVGYDEQGLPVGMQAIGRYWDERTLLRIAYAAEQRVERRKPGIFYPLLGTA